MEREVTDLTAILLQIYKTNLEFLEVNFNDLFLRVEKLSQDLASEKLSPKYSLEYRDGYFDILNLTTNSWFYGSNSYEDADRRAKHANFTKDGSLDLLRKGIDGEKLIGGKNISDIMPVISYINENVDLKNVEFERIYKFVFICSGLGFHIHEIAKKLDPFTTLIIEPELEIFRLSLFTIDYSELQKGNRKLFLSVGEDKPARIKSLDTFYFYHNYMNYNVKHHLLIENERYLYDELVDYFSTNTATSFPYVHTIQNIFKIMDFVESKYKFLDFNSMVEKKILSDKKVLLVAAGPSLDGYIDWIFQNQDKFTIVCVDVILRKLEKNKIVPDIVVSIDPSHLCADYLTCEDPEFLNNSAVILLAQQNEKVLDVVKKENVYVSQSIPLIGEIGYLGSASNVGTFSYMMCLHLGANEIYTIGNDAAFNQATGSRYATESSWSQSEALHLEQKKDMVSMHDVVEVKGNLRETVKTNRSLLVFKDSFESITPGLKQAYNYEVFNLSDGVYMEGFEPMTQEELEQKIAKTILKSHNIQEMLNGVSKVIEKLDFKDDAKKIINLINRVKKYKKLSITSRNDFLEKKLEMMVWILEQSKKMKNSVFGNIFLFYTELADIYINFVLNLKQENLHTNESLQNINQIWSNGLLAVLNDFKKISEK